MINISERADVSASANMMHCMHIHNGEVVVVGWWTTPTKIKVIDLGELHPSVKNCPYLEK